MIKSIALLGASGSIGRQTAAVIRNNKDRFRIASAVVNSDYRYLKQLSDEFDIKTLGVTNASVYSDAKRHIGSKVKIYSGIEALEAAVGSESVDTAINAIVGYPGLRASLIALMHVKTLALANKESIVAGGSIVTALAKKNGVSVIPVDSEHSAIFRILNNSKEQPKRLILTASGGPFFFSSIDELRAVTPAQATKHPTWNMGAKISVDSATMMNKGYEIIEAKHLFGISDVSYVIHRESVIHSMAEFMDNTVIMQGGCTSMEIPISYALSYPDVLPVKTPGLDLPSLHALTFYEPDEKRFPAPALCRRAFDMGGLYPAALCAANDEAVAMFLDGKIRFTDITTITEHVLGESIDNLTVNADNIFMVIENTSEYVRSSFNKI